MFAPVFHSRAEFFRLSAVKRQVQTRFANFNEKETGAACLSRDLEFKS